MANPKRFQPLGRGEYCGRILHGPYSENLKRRVAECILIFRKFDNIGTLAIPYIAAWHEKDKVIWYEFVSRRFARILGTEYSEVAETFRNSILERRIYKSLETDWSVKEEVLSHRELKGPEASCAKRLRIKESLRLFTRVPLLVAKSIGSKIRRLLSLLRRIESASL